MSEFGFRWFEMLVVEMFVGERKYKPDSSLHEPSALSQTNDINHRSFPLIALRSHDSLAMFGKNVATKWEL